ncbi:MAG: hypothetical protein J6U96_01375 [Elusimicrobiaceae bacterium]|nr:hypothetical protein [Elusimicrobiaceae bacterium]
MAENLLTPALTVFEQMALDEVLTHANAHGPVLRFYHWTDGPAVTFGYSQFYNSVQSQLTPDKGPACRRPTGGGIVFHGADLTFSLIFESELRPSEIYARLHGAIENALAQVQLQSTRQGAVSAAVYAPATNGIASGCFANPVKDDLLVNGKKILGGAIRRFGTQILYQGSLQCENARTHPVFRRAVVQAVQQMLAVQFETKPVAEELLKQARELALSQYQTTAWTEKFL